MKWFYREIQCDWVGEPKVKTKKNAHFSEAKLALTDQHTTWAQSR